ncbi:MAG TPA: DHH family phosphoesterase [Candidatus Cloacimonadota bacterium]|nr:DHH family phosphoesterase [Candidatus Cloacimonadota bacterium]
MVDKWSLPQSPTASFVDQLKGSRPQLDLDSDPGLEALPDESLFANIDEVVDRIRKAMYNNEPLVIFGHDDPDGITSTYILYQFFNSCGYQRHNYYIPNRNTTSHGIQDDFVEYVRREGYKLVITVDNGIASYGGVEKLNAMGCDTLIVDHHLIQPDQLPRAFAVLNPQLPQCAYPFKALAGVGVVLMLIRYLGRLLDHKIPASAYFWTAVGSIADKMPMIGLNRLLVRHVIKHWSEVNDPSIEFLLRNFNRVSSDMDVFNFIVYASRVIANGREDGGQHMGMRFLLQMGDEKAVLFQTLEVQKKQWEGELNRVFGFLDTITAGFDGNAFIYYDDEDVIPYNLLGTASTYVVSNFGIPTIMLKHHNGNMVCEGRCGDGFNMVEAFTRCKDHLLQFGGHTRAAGFTMDAASYDAFLECYNDYLSQNQQREEIAPLHQIDVLARPEDLSLANWNYIQQLLPFGMQNPEPLLMLQSTTLLSLQQHYQIEYNSVNIPSSKELDIIFHWKSPGSIRVMDYKLRPPGN